MLLDDPNEVEELTRILMEQGPETRLLLAETNLGEDAASFAASDLGRYVIGRANLELTELIAQLKTTSPLRYFKMQRLQNEIWKREAFKTYLLEAIQSGRSALAELSQRHSEAESTP